MIHLIEGAKIYTFGEGMPVAEALAVASGIVKAVGTRKNLRARFPGAVRIDAGGEAVIPAFNDSHCHILLTGLDLAKADLSNARSVEDIVNRLSSHASRRSESSWIFGVGYDQNLLPGRQHLHRCDLDRVSALRPVLIKHSAGHCIVGNSKAFETAGIHPDTADPEDGLIVRDEAGRPTGVLLEGARLLLENSIPDPTIPERTDAIKAAADKMASRGTLAATDCSFGRYGLEEEWAAYAGALEHGAPLRMTLMPRAAMAEKRNWTDREKVDLKAAHHNLRLGPVKFFLDGAILARTAAMKDPYTDGSATSIMMYEPNRFKRLFLEYHLGGWQIATHAIGDAAIELVIHACELAQTVRSRPDVRHRIEHCAIISLDNIKRMSWLGMIAAAQPEFIRYFGDSYAAALGQQRAENIMPYRTWLESGVSLCLGSDQPVVDHDPLVGWRSAVERKTPGGQVLGAEECIDPLTALRCFTLESALAGMDRHIGRLVPGQQARVCVLSGLPETMAEAPVKLVATSRDLLQPAPGNGAP